MTCYRGMSKITERITNKKVLDKIRKKSTEEERERRAQMIRQTFRHGGLLKYNLKGKMGKKRK